MKEIKENAKNKGVKIINSCKNVHHLIGAKKYLELFLNNFNDENSYNELKLLYESKNNELLNFLNVKTFKKEICGN